MRFKLLLLAAFTYPLFLAGCGGNNTLPYDGTWQVALPLLSKDSTIATDKVVACNNPGGILVIKDSAGTTILSASCTTTLIDTNGAQTTYPAVITTASVGVNITAKASTSQKDVLNAIVNGATYTGTCISTVSCSAVSAAGDTLSLTR